MTGRTAPPRPRATREPWPPLTDREFQLFRALVYRSAGISLGPAKKALVAARLGRRVHALGLRSFGEYYRFVTQRSEDELVNLLDAITTNETHFFREPQQFAFLRERVVPEWVAQAETGLRARRIRAWSAGCSTGEEPYSLAMVLLDQFPPPTGWSIEILATDISTAVLAKARQALWPLAKADAIPRRYLKTYMLRGVRSQAGKLKAGPEIRSLIRFRRLNLIDDVYDAAGPYDLILCRNVLIYFDAASRAHVIDRLLDRLAPTGYLFVGHAESLNGVTDRARCAAPMVYARIASDPHRNTAGRARSAVHIGSTPS